MNVCIFFVKFRSVLTERVNGVCKKREWLKDNNLEKRSREARVEMLSKMSGDWF